MTTARRLAPDQTHAIARRCAGRRLLLTPSARVNQILLYTLGLALQRHEGVRLHAYAASTTHTHTVVTDAPEVAQLPAFLGYQHSLSGRALNCHHGVGENFWKTGSYGNVEIHQPSAEELADEDGPPAADTLDEQLLYLWSNVVKDGLVADPSDWPGVFFGPEDFGRTITVARPDDAFFGSRRPDDWEPTEPRARARHRRTLRLARERERARQKHRDRKRGRSPKRSRQLAREREQRERRAKRRRRVRRSLPETVTVTIAPPPGYEDWPIEDVRARFRALLDERLQRIHAERAAAGLTEFMGVEAILARDPRSSAGDTFPDFSLSPRVACKPRKARIRRLVALVAWRHEYRRAYLAWRDGDRRRVFPLGTYGVVRFHGALAEQPARSPPRAAA